MSIPLSVSMLLFCYLVLQQGSSSPQALYKRSLSFRRTHTGACLFSPEPWEVNDMPTTCQRRTRPLLLSPLVLANLLTITYAWEGLGVVLWKHKTLLNLPALETIANRAHFLVMSGLVWEAHLNIHTKTTTSSFFFFLTKLQVALTFNSQAIRSYLECVTRAILHHLTDQEPPCKAGLGMSRYRFGEKREWGM